MQIFLNKKVYFNHFFNPKAYIPVNYLFLKHSANRLLMFHLNEKVLLLSKIIAFYQTFFFLLFENLFRDFSFFILNKCTFPNNSFLLTFLTDLFVGNKLNFYKQKSDTFYHLYLDLFS
jgi:hypothetical protein